MGDCFFYPTPFISDLVGALALLFPGEIMDHPERVRTTILEARSLPQSERRAKITQLSHGFLSDRWLAVVVAAHAGELDLMVKGLRDPSLSVRAQSAALSAKHLKHVDPALFTDLDEETLNIFSRNLLRREPEVLEPVVEALIACGRLETAARLLPACSDEFVQSRLDLAWPGSVWGRLAKYSPDTLVSEISKEFAESRRPEEVWGRYHSHVWSKLSETRPKAVFEWVDNFVSSTQLPYAIIWSLNELVRHDISKVIQWLSRPGNQYQLPKRLVKRARYVELGELAPLATILLERRPELFGQLISMMDFPSRDRLFVAATKDIDSSTIEWPIALLERLGAHLRDREAARMLELPRAKKEGTWRRSLMGMRLLENAREALETELRSAKAEERGEAWGALVNATRLQRGGWESTLQSLLKTKKDQDPVRAAYLSALARVPGYQFKEPALLEEVINPLFEARDASWDSRRSVTIIAQNLMVSNAASPRSAQFALALRLLDKIAGHSGTPSLPLLHRGLPKGAEHAVFGALKPWLEAAKSRQIYSHIFMLYWALGKRAWNVEGLEAMVEDIMWKGQKSQAPTAARYWLLNPATRGERVLAMLKKDGSAIHLSEVFNYCAQRHQSLMMPRFSKPIKGRFHDGKVDYVPQIERGFWRWTEEQQTAFAQLIRRASREKDQFGFTRSWMVRQLGNIPVITVRDLEEELNSKDVLVQEAALGALVWLDDSRGALEILMSHLDTDRAHVAMYALPRLARVVSADEMVDALEGLLGQDRLKVTVHKEALRLLGGVGNARALRLLHTEFGKPLHRDVRIAALHAARSTLDNVLSWQILEAASHDEDRDVVRAVFEVSVSNIPLVWRKRYLNLMLSVRPTDPEIWQALANAINQNWYLVDLEASLDFGFGIISDSNPGVPWQSMLGLLRHAAQEPRCHTSLEALIIGLVDRAEVEFEVRKDHDQDAFWRVKNILRVLSGSRHEACQEFNRNLGRKIARREVWWADGARLHLHGCGVDSLFEEFEAWVADAVSPMSARGLEDVARELAEHPAIEWDAEVACALTERACGCEDPRMRRVGFGFLKAFGSRWHWGPRWVDVLNALRKDKDLDLKLAARMVRPQ